MLNNLTQSIKVRSHEKSFDSCDFLLLFIPELVAWRFNAWVDRKTTVQEVMENNRPSRKEPNKYEQGNIDAFIRK